MKISEKKHTVEITKRFLQLADEVVREGMAKNRREFSESIGRHYPNFTRLETFEQAPTLEQIAVACKTYGYNPAWLILGVGEKKMKASEQKPVEVRISTLETEMAQLKRLINGWRSNKNSNKKP